jgi:hypothetical protein
MAVERSSDVLEQACASQRHHGAAGYTCNLPVHLPFQQWAGGGMLPPVRVQVQKG